MSGYQEICLLLVLVCLNPAIIERNLADASELYPNFRMTFVVWYNNSGESVVSFECGQYYAQTFLNSYIQTESVLQKESSCGEKNRLNVGLEVKARVRLYGKKIELNTYININRKPGIAFNSEVMSQILDCSNVLKELLKNPQEIQSEFNTGKDPRHHIDLFKIPRNSSCEEISLNPEEFIYDDGEWLCNNPNHFFSEEQVKCKPYETSIPIVHTTTTPQNTEIKKSTSVSPSAQYWSIQLLNQTNSITLKEGNEPVRLYFNITVNQTRLCGNIELCKVVVSLNIKSNPDDLLRCRTTGEIISQVVFVQPSWGQSREVCAFTMDVNVTRSEKKYIDLAPMLDGKYDGTQYRELSFSVRSIINEEAGPSQEDAVLLPVIVEDEDQKATCKSINDPHIATFDGTEYNNFYQGEFVLYEHINLPYKVHVIYQECGRGIAASCNCAVAVQSGDDVIVIDRCLRKKKTFNRILGTSRPYEPIMTVNMYLNNDLTPGTTIFEEADGMKYYIYLPHGGTVKVMVSGLLLNVWVIASPKDKGKTTGLCGTYDDNKLNDFQLNDKTVIPYTTDFTGYRIQPREFCEDWRVELFGEKSIFKGVNARDSSSGDDGSALSIFCDCSKDYRLCGYAVDVSLCDVLQGTDVTQFLIDRAQTPVSLSTQRRRRRRQTVSNVISALPPEDPIDIDTSYVPADASWDNSDWTEQTAQHFCLDYVKNYPIGLLCQQIPAVDFNQEITTCIEDIQITGNTTWANSARDSMKEQCLEEVQRNSSLPQDIASEVQNSICINDCSGHGNCVTGTCQCEAMWTSADCSDRTDETPYTSELPTTGLCDTRYMNCKRVIVYGNDFISGENLTCHLQEAEVTEKSSDFKAEPTIITRKALYINFNAVECPIPDLKNYLVSVSNDGNFDHSSDPLLFIPFDSACTTCSTNTTSCTKKRNSCIIDGLCFEEEDASPNDPCLICKPHAEDLEWTTQIDGSCRVSWWQSVSVPNWMIAVIAAVGGSVLGIVIGIVIYKCCCKKRRSQKKAGHHPHTSDHNHLQTDRHRNHHNHLNHPPEDSEITDTDTNQESNTGETSPFEDAMLHRNRGLPTFSDDRFLDIPFHHAEYDHNYSFPNTAVGAEEGDDLSPVIGVRGVGTGRVGVQNGVDSTTYF